MDFLGLQPKLGSVHISSVRKILSAKARLQGEKRSKVGHLASIFNAAGAFLSQKIATRWSPGCWGIVLIFYLVLRIVIPVIGISRITTSVFRKSTAVEAKHGLAPCQSDENGWGGYVRRVFSCSSDMTHLFESGSYSFNAPHVAVSSSMSVAPGMGFCAARSTSARRCARPARPSSISS